MQIDFQCLRGGLQSRDQDLLKECSALYSEHYGKWSSVSKRAGKKIKQSPNDISALLANDDAFICLARDYENDNKLVGYALAVHFQVCGGKVAWVTQLVVHADYRNAGIAKRILYSIWGFSDYYAWGLVSASPYAVRALEKATHRRCEPQCIKKNVDKLIQEGSKVIPYVKENAEYFADKNTTSINTDFFSDHSSVNEMLKNVTQNAEWKLGHLDEGWEWFAFTFKKQAKSIQWSEEEFDEMLRASDDVVKDAYSRMKYDGGKQKWTQGTSAEVDFIMQHADLKPGGTVFDFGCGQGRHALALARHPLNITAVDYLRENIEKLRRENARCNHQGTISALTGDCRNIKLQQQATCIICLYDVIGSYTDNRQNQLILKNIYHHLENNGTAVISVMNYDYEPLAVKAEKIDSSDELKERLFDLRPSPTMETSGNVFCPDYCIIDANTHTVYRKEQFSLGSELPAELLVRDRRFTKQEIEEMCRETGFEVILSRYIRAGNWQNTLSPEESKEILLVCRKTTQNQLELFDDVF